MLFLFCYIPVNALDTMPAGFIRRIDHHFFYKLAQHSGRQLLRLCVFAYRL